jgi:hypothetical protein
MGVDPQVDRFSDKISIVERTIGDRIKRSNAYCYDFNCSGAARGVLESRRFEIMNPIFFDVVSID